MGRNRFDVFPSELIIHRGKSCVVCSRDGIIGGGRQGFYLYNTRFLSRLDLRVDGKPPRPVSANAVDANSMIAYFLAASPEGDASGPTPERPGSGGEIARSAIEIQVDTVVDGGLLQRVHVSNHGLVEARLDLALRFAADFADQSEARAGRRRQRAPVEAHWSLDPDSAELALRYAHPKLDLGLLVRIRGGALRWLDEPALHLALVLTAQAQATIEIELCPRVGDELFEPRSRRFGDPSPDASWVCASAELETNAPLLGRAWHRAAEDLAGLALGEGMGTERAALAAGIPTYQALFGRDMLIAGIQSRLLSPAMLRGALSLMARWQGRRVRPERDEEPGKLLHQRQQSPLAVLGLNPFLAYYGDYTAPAMFLIGVALDFAASADRGVAMAMRPHVLAALDWMDRYGDRDGDGFYEYDTRAEHGLKNQGWKDSGQALLYPDGRLVENPIAMAEVQAAYYAAKQLAGLWFLMLGEHERARALLAAAEALKRRFNAEFWLPEERYIGLALDPEKRLVATVGPDGGQCLAYGIVDAERSGAVVNRLMQPDLFSGWGLRTLSSEHPAYNPFGYHLGDVWPWANALIAFGLRRFGFEREFEQLARALCEATSLFALDRLPEAIGGQPRDAAHPHPGIYPASNSPQAWSASAVISLVETMLGLVPLTPLGIVLVDPVLPDWVPSLTLSNLETGRGRLSLRFRRDASGWTEHEVLAAPDGLRVIRPEEPARRGTDKFARDIEHVARECGVQRLQSDQ